LKRVARSVLLMLVACGRDEVQPQDSGWIVTDDDGGDANAIDAGTDVCTRDEGCATSVSAGRHLACAIKDGAVYCWGSSDFGALGTAPSKKDALDYFANERYKSTPQLVGGLPPATRVVAGDNFACALSHVGQIWCWGSNDRGQLGHTAAIDGTCTRPDGGDLGACTPTPLPVDGIATSVHVVDLAVGDHAVCATTDDGDLYCWGSNVAGVAGQPLEQAYVLSAKLVATTADLSKRTTHVAMALDEPFACALRDDMTVWCWGDDRSGRVGRAIGTLDGCDGGCTATPTQVLENDGGALGGVLRIAIGGASACAQTASNVRCWGGNELGELARGTWDGDPHPVPATAQVASGSTALVGGGDTYFARDAFGQNLIWGRDEEGQIGTGESYGADTTQTQPCSLYNWSSPVAPGLCFGRAQILSSQYVTLSPGHQFVAAIDRNGAVWAWGDEAAGELGQPSDNFSDECDTHWFLPVSCLLHPQLVF